MIKWFIAEKKVNENEAENMFLASQWLSYSQYINKEKLKESFLSTKHFIEAQLNLERYFTDSDYNHLLNLSELKQSSRCKSFIRAGTPCKFIRGIVMKMFIEGETNEGDLKNIFNVRFLSVFKNREPGNFSEFVPYFSNNNDFEASLKLHWLNQKGVEALKEIMWLLNSIIPDIEYSPLIVYLTSISLLFMTKEETYCCLKNIIIQDFKNHEHISLLRFRFALTFEDNKKLILAFIECFTHHPKISSRELLAKFEKIGFNFEELIEDMFFTFFIEYFNFVFLTRFYMCFLSEGSKILFRVAYAVLITFTNEILEFKEKGQVIPLLKKKCFEMKNANEFFKLAFKFNLSRYNNKYSEVKFFGKIEKKNNIRYYIPIIEGESRILTDKEVFLLWNLFPSSYSEKEAKLIYSTDENKNTLEKIYEICNCSDYSCLSSLCIIKTNNDEKFGLLMSTPFDNKREGYYCPSFINLFTLKPKVEVFHLNENSEIYSEKKIITCNNEKIIVGIGEKGPAIEIDQDMKVGFTFPTEIFGNAESLAHNSDFIIDKIEIYSLK